jgi:uncharacterized membrane protein
MPKSTLAGHPLHPQMVPFPLGVLPLSLVLDILYVTSRDKNYSHASFYTLIAGFFGGAAAGVAGLSDYLSIPRRSKAKKVATLHGVLNLGLMLMLSANLLLRAGGRHRWSNVGFLLSMLGNAGLTVSAWYGGQLVYTHGVRVKGAAELEDSDEIRPPADERMEDALVRLEENFERLVEPLTRDGGSP